MATYTYRPDISREGIPNTYIDKFGKLRTHEGDPLQPRTTAGTPSISATLFPNTPGTEQLSALGTTNQQQTHTYPVFKLAAVTHDIPTERLQKGYGTLELTALDWVRKVQTGVREYNPENPRDEELRKYYEQLEKQGLPEKFKPWREIAATFGPPIVNKMGEQVYRAFSDPYLQSLKPEEKLWEAAKTTIPGTGKLPGQILDSAKSDIRKFLTAESDAGKGLAQGFEVIPELATENLAKMTGNIKAYRDLTSPGPGEEVFLKNLTKEGEKGSWWNPLDKDTGKVSYKAFHKDYLRDKGYFYKDDKLISLKDEGLTLGRPITETAIPSPSVKMDQPRGSDLQPPRPGEYQTWNVGGDQKYIPPPGSEFGMGDVISALDPNVPLTLDKAIVESGYASPLAVGKSAPPTIRLDQTYDLKPDYLGQLRSAKPVVGATEAPYLYSEFNTGALPSVSPTGIETSLFGVDEPFSRSILAPAPAAGPVVKGTFGQGIAAGEADPSMLTDVGTWKGAAGGAVANFGLSLLLGQKPLKAAIGAVGAGLGSILGQALIPIPGLGGFIGSSLGGMLGGRVICNELHRQGFLERRQVILDYKFTRDYLTPKHVKGYHVWATHVVRKLREGKQISLWRHMAIHRAREIEYIYGERDKPDYLGKIYRHIGEPICWVLGNFCKETDWSVLYQPKEI